MKKLKLELDALSVETFEPSRVKPWRTGTVRGNATTACSPLDTCEHSCHHPDSCQFSCMDCTQGLPCTVSCP
jgi:hypothetical protein